MTSNNTWNIEGKRKNASEWVKLIKVGSINIEVGRVLDTNKTYFFIFFKDFVSFFKEVYFRKHLISRFPDLNLNL